MKPLSEEMRAEVKRRYVPGVFGYNAVAKEFGISPTTVKRILNPEFAERQRAISKDAKRKRRGICERCGGETRYNGHRVNGPSHICASCQREIDMASRIWTREAIIEAIQRWAEEHGRPPSATDWVRSGDGHPATSNVFRSRHRSARHNAFASWADAIQAAGFERPEVGGRYRERPWTQLHDRAEILRLLNEGLSPAEVARRVGCSHELARRLRQDGTTAKVRS